MTDRSKPEIKNLTDEAPGILAKAGIPTAITVDQSRKFPCACCR